MVCHVAAAFPLACRAVPNVIRLKLLFHRALVYCCGSLLKVLLLLRLMLLRGDRRVRISSTILNVLQHLQRLLDHILVLECLRANFPTTYRLYVLVLLARLGLLIRVVVEI